MSLRDGLRIVSDPVVVRLSEDSLSVSCCLNGRCLHVVIKLILINLLTLSDVDLSRKAVISTDVGYFLEVVRFVNIYLKMVLRT